MTVWDGVGLRLCRSAAGGATVTFQDDGEGVGPEALSSGTERLVFRYGQIRPVSANFHFRWAQTDL